MDSPNLLEKVNDLNRKISHLSVQKTGTGTGEEISRIVSLDFIESDKIEEIEKGIRATVKGVVMSRAAVCKSLANIDRKRLYTQVGYTSFLQYLQAQRVPIKYKTAKEYAKIGDTLIRYEVNLRNVEFNEEEGLKKLIFLDKALKNHSSQKDQVFRKVKESSLRDFQRYAGIDELRQTETEPAAEIRGLSLFRRNEEGEEIEVLRITDPRILDSPQEENARVFMKSLQKVTETFLKAGKPRE